MLIKNALDKVNRIGHGTYANKYTKECAIK